MSANGAKLCWLTDPHFNVAGIQRAEALLAQVRRWGADALLVSGDIGESPDLPGWLDLMAMRAGCPVYIVLGNHDFYHGSVDEVRALTLECCAAHGAERLRWLGEPGCVVSLTAQTALVGHDGWGDGRLGDVMGSRVMLADFSLIADLAGRDRVALAARLAQLGEEAAAHLAHVLPLALRDHAHVIVLTHVPPFQEACWHEGTWSDEAWLPFFSCHAVGEVVREVMAAHPHRTAQVLCGHTHSAGVAQILPNLWVETGAAVYRQPALQAPRWVR